MTFKLNDNYTAAGVLAFSLLVTGFLVAGAQTEPVVVQGGGEDVELVSVSSITFPVPELGNCKDAQSCKKYCDDSANAEKCLNFAEAHKLMRPGDLARAKKMAAIVKTGGGPGGCKNKQECANYCEANTDRLAECVSFAEKSGLVPEKELQEMKQVQKALSSGAKLPGGCKNKQECDKYCSNSANMEECISFAEASGMIKGKELEEAKKVMPFIKRGETPGGCKTKEACEAYCGDSSHATECITFAEKAGFMSKEEAEMARKTGGRGPGGCNSKESCDAFCNQKENQQTCFNFAKEHDLIPEGQLKQMEEGMARLRVGLREMPGEVVQCLKDKIGPDAVGQIESGKLMPGKDIGDTIQACFSQFKPQMAAKMQEGLKNAPPEITSCLQGSLGAEGFQKLQQGDVDNPDDGDKVKVCFEKMREIAGAQMRDSARQLENLPPQARDCVKQKLGSDFFGKLQSGNPDEMQGAGDRIGPVVSECMSQMQGEQGGPGGFSGPGSENGNGPSPEQFREMRERGGAPGGFPGSPTPEQIKEMMEKEGASPEQIKEMMEKRGAFDGGFPGSGGGFPGGAPTPKEVESMMIQVKRSAIGDFSVTSSADEQTRIKEMMQKKGFPGEAQGVPSPEQIKEMMQKQGAPSGSEGTLSPTQIKDMMQGKGVPGVPSGPNGSGGAPSPEQIKQMMQGQGSSGGLQGVPSSEQTKEMMQKNGVPSTADIQRMMPRDIPQSSQGVPTTAIPFKPTPGQINGTMQGQGQSSIGAPQVFPKEMMPPQGAMQPQQTPAPASAPTQTATQPAPQPATTPQPAPQPQPAAPVAQ